MGPAGAVQTEMSVTLPCRTLATLRDDSRQ